MAWPANITKIHVDEVKDNPQQARAELEAAIDAINDIINSRAAVSGICELDAAGKIPIARYETIQATSKVLFKQNWVPTGWTFVAEHNDRAILLTDTLAVGGSTGGVSWARDDLTFEHVHLISGTTSAGPCASSASGTGSEHSTCNHTHTYSAYSTGSRDPTVNTNPKTAVDCAGTWRPPYVSMITCQKN